MYNKINQYQKLIKEVNEMETNKGIEARINPKAKRTKKRNKKRK